MQEKACESGHPREGNSTKDGAKVRALTTLFVLNAARPQRDLLTASQGCRSAFFFMPKLATVVLSNTVQ